MIEKIGFLISGLLGLFTILFLAIGVHLRNKDYGQSLSIESSGVRFFLLAALSFGFAWFMLEGANNGFSWNIVGNSLIGAMIFLIMLAIGEALRTVSSKFLVTKNSSSPLEQLIKIYKFMARKTSNEQDSGKDGKHEEK